MVSNVVRGLIIVLLLALALGGIERPLREAPAARAAFPGENGRIVFGGLSGKDLTTIEPDGTSSQSLGEGIWPRWSPDGSKIAFTGGVYTSAIPQSGDWDLVDIYVMNGDGTDVRNVTQDGVTGGQLAWSPQGDEIAVNIYTPFGSPLTIDFIDVASGGRRSLAVPGINSSTLPISWSRNGEILFTGVTAQGSTPNYDLYKIRSDGTGLTRLTTDARPEFAGDWSPDGSKMVYSTREGIYVANANGSNPTRILASSGVIAPVWSPDGTRIAYVTFESSPIGIAVMGSNGADPRRVASGNSPDWGSGSGQCLGSPAGAARALPASSPPPDNDRDGDNIPDDEEERIGTDPDCHDTDGDGLLDSWEVEEDVEGAGFDLDRNGEPEVSRDEVFGPYAGECQTLGPDFGPRREPRGRNCDLVHAPDPLHKDVYVEMDWQDCFNGDCPELIIPYPGIPNIGLFDPSHHAPNMDGLGDTIAVFADAPVENPDGEDGINLHVLVDEDLNHIPNCDKGAATRRSPNFGTPEQRADPPVIAAKENAFRYAWSGHSSRQDDAPGACTLPSFVELMTTGYGLCCLPEYDISPAGDAEPGGRDIIVSLAITWICQLYTFDAGDGVYLPPCFRKFHPVYGVPMIPGLFPALIEGDGEEPVEVPIPMHVSLGVDASEGVRQIWGRTMMNLLGRSLGVPSGLIGNDPSQFGAALPDSYGSWSGLALAPPGSLSSALSSVESSGGGTDLMPNFAIFQQDTDGDGVPEGVDNCPGLANPGQADLDDDRLGDACDVDEDGDDLIGGGDSFPGDTDNDGLQNATDGDDDNDGVPDQSDNCALGPNPAQVDTDGDGEGNGCDVDSDDDGLPDGLELTAGSDPLSASNQPELVGYEDSCTDSEDNDGDGKTDDADTGCQDPDGDTVPSSLDNCPAVASINIQDANADGVGDRCEDERAWGDNDCSGVVDSMDALLVLYFGSPQGASAGDCPALGAVVEVTGASAHLWGDVDCSGAINTLDALKLLRFRAGVSVTQPQGCPAVGSSVRAEASEATIPRRLTIPD